MQRRSTGSKLRPKKRFGQNFLIDSSIVDEILGAADVTETDTVLEIGPGRGVLTSQLVKSAKQVYAVEIDRDLAKLLREKFFNYDNIEIIENDFLKQELSEIIPPDESFKVVANLPYYITTPILMKLLEGESLYSEIVVMVQREVANRMVANAGSPDYGALSLAVEFYSNARIVCEVPPESFRPVPKVTSAVVALKRRTPVCTGEKKELLFKCIKASFEQRRKTLVNALSSAELISKDDCKKILKSLGFDENIRGEKLSLSEFIELSKKIGEENGR